MDWTRARHLVHGIVRIVIGAAFFSHGAQKQFGWFGGFGESGTADLFTRFGAAGIIETIGGTLIILGLFTRPAAFIVSGEMAVAYFWVHVAGSGSLWWWANRGELPLLYCFMFLLFFFIGPGGLSLDATIAKRRRSGSQVPGGDLPGSDARGGSAGGA